MTIEIKDVNEAPTMSAGATKISNAENTNITNGVDNDYSATDQESTETADDDCTDCTWSLSGADAGDLEITRDGGLLTFKNEPNFESPADADMDNMYMVTVVATDSGTPK